LATQVLTGREQHSVPGFSYSAKINLLENIEPLGSVPAIFAELSKGELTHILSCARVRTFVRDELLFSQGQGARNLIVLQSGSVKHTQLSSNGYEVLMHVSGPGDAVNLQMDLNTCTHSCSARAKEESRAWIWETAKLQELLDRYPRLRTNITHLLASRLVEIEERFREVATEAVPRRLALVLLRLMKQIGKYSAEGTRVLLSREELAQMTGATLFTVSRLLSSWAEQGLVSRRRRVVVIRDATRLRLLNEELV